MDSLQPNRTQNFTYDSLNRVATAQSQATSGPDCWGQSYGYDPWANLLSETTTRCSGTSFSVGVYANNRITNPGITYDAAGNMTSDAVHTYTYDAENRLTQVDGGSTATYVYNGSGQRMAKTVGSTTTEYLYDESGNVVTEWCINCAGYTGWTVGYIHAGGQLLAEYTNGTTYFIHKDHLGSTRVMTKVDGSVYDSLDYLPFGEQIAGSAGSTHKFTGKERDAESGLDNFEARYMSSSLGRFMSADDSKYINPADPQTFNLYSYVANNPINAVDPTGHDPVGVSGYNCRTCHMPTIEGGGGPTSEGGGGSVESEMDESFLGALSGNFEDDDATAHDSSAQNGSTAQQARNAIVSSQTYKTMDEAAIAAEKIAMRDTKDKNQGKTDWEFGGWIVQDSEGNFRYTIPLQGSERGETDEGKMIVPKGFTKVAGYHTHGILDSTDEGFSQWDMKGVADVFHRPEYLGAVFSGDIRKYVPGVTVNNKDKAVSGDLIARHVDF
jgi:RHS repeat-associated protein